MPSPSGPKAKSVRCEQNCFRILLDDGRQVSIPWKWYWRLHTATRSQRRNLEIWADGEALRWPSVDEDLLVANLIGSNPEKCPVRPKNANIRRHLYL